MTIVNFDLVPVDIVFGCSFEKDIDEPKKYILLAKKLKKEYFDEK